MGVETHFDLIALLARHPKSTFREVAAELICHLNFSYKGALAFLQSLFDIDDPIIQAGVTTALRNMLQVSFMDLSGRQMELFVPPGLMRPNFQKTPQF